MDQLHYLDDVKGNKTDEWRLAKSIEDLDNFLSEKYKNGEYYDLKWYMFASIRYCLRELQLHRFIKPLEIFNFFNDTNIASIIDYFKSAND